MKPKAVILDVDGTLVDGLRGALAVYADTADLLAKYDSSPFSGR